ncbi:mitochondrial splicing system protein [Hypoxylon texense]
MLRDPPKPVLGGLSLGAEKPEDAPTTVTKDGVHCCSSNKTFAKKLVTLAEKWDIWRDKGVIKLPEDEKMTVDLVENWQKEYKAG